MAVRKMWRCRGRGGKVMMGCCGHALLVLMLLSMDCCCRAQVHNLSLAVDEGLPPGTLVGDIRAGLPEGSPGEGFFLSEESGDSPVLRDFQIDTDTGIVRTLRILDRERRERYSFVAATLLGEVVQVEIRVRDVNDHSPTFPVQSLHLQVSELTPPGTTFRLPAARDPDKGEYGLRGYSLLRGSQEASFIIRYGDGKSSVGVAGKDWGQAREQVRGAGNTNRARATLQVWKQIDESRQGSEQDKTAFDSAEYGTTSEGLGAHTGGTWVGISELTPVYGSKEESGGSHFEGEEGWDSELGAQQYGRQVKLAFLGYNQDAQSEGYVYESYPDTVGNDRSDSNEELQVEGSSTDSRLHHLDLELVQWLDREVVDKYHLEVEAFDGGHPSRTGRLFIDITVLDANDNPPTFDQAEYKGWVWENAPVGTSVCTVHAADPDLGSNGEVSYNLWSGEEYFSVEESTGIVRVSRPLDRENKALHQLVVQAKDGGSQPEISSVLVMVKVLDVNDNKPNIQVTLLTESGQLEVSEGARIGEYLARISVSDSDLEFEEEPWETSGDEGRRFESEGSPRDNGSLVGQTLVNKKTGKNTPQSERFTKFGEGSQKVNPENIGSPQLVSLTLEGADGSFSLRPVGPQVYFLCVEALLDREQKDLYELHLLASDSGSPPLQTLKTLLFRISDVNDQVPLFSQPNGYQVMVSESSPPGTAILNLNAKDLDEEGPNSSVVYTLLDNTSSVFMLDPYTGVLSITGILDFETETVINLVALATDQGEPPLSSTCQVTVMIEDSNDNEPVFMQQFYNVTLQEHSALGYCFLQVKATDSDSGSFGQVHYSLYDRAHSSKESQKFAIDRDSGHICVSQDIDREADPGTYDLLVKAEDEGGLSTQAFVHVEIEDINDNVPVFETTNYVASISSHTQAGTEILNVLAVDQDAGTFGEVLYEIIPGEKTSLFTMDSAAGIIYLVSALSHLEDSQVTFFVSAKDKGGRRSPVNASVTVKILKTAVAPAIFEKSRYTFFVAEDVPLGTTVGTVKAREPINSVEPISYRILSGDLHDMFSIISEFGVIITRTALDHETQAIVVLTIQSQLGNSSVFSSTQVNITITDVNDNPPVFPRKNERISVYQTIPPGSTLYIAQAEDIDSGYNGIITYSITSGKQDMFVIDPGTGILYLNTTLTMLCEHILLIMAEDNGRPALSSLLTLTIVVTKPKTDNTLTFGNLVHQIEINEDFPIYARVLQVKAYIEGAQSQKSKILYTLQPDDSVMFGIHYHTGWIFLRRSLDYERTTVYNLIVLASCSDFTKEQTATTSVVVKVLDVNDNSPVFSQPLYFYTVPESSSPLGVIDKMKASDSDSGKNGQLSFYLLSAENDFQINSQTGELVNCAALDHEQKTHHQLTVLVTDHGTPRRNTTTTVYITVTDLNDNKPYFPQLPSGKQLHVKVPEGQTGHMLVTTVFAKDPDAASNGTVLYYLSSDDDLGHFIINISTGEIWTTQALSTSIRPYYRLTVTARDQGVPPLEDYAVVNIQVISTAEGKSKGSIKVKILKIPEDAKPSQVVDSLISYGDWIIPNRKVQGHISEKEHNNHFLVDSATGDIYVSTPLDFETNPSYFLRFSIQDINKMPPQFHSVILKIDIEDTNDHHPMFPDPMLVIGIKENSPIGTVLYTFRAKDGDGSIPNSKVKYSLQADGTGKYPFFIHEWDGILTTNKQLDRETVESYVLTVTAVDQAIDGTPRRRCSLTARIIVQDINDNNPSFLSSAAASVMEDAEIGLLVHRVAAEDPDEGRNGKITFHITDGNSEGMFLLDEITGWLTLSSTLDREIRENYILSILATDNGTPILSATQILTVTVGDVNDNSPTFNQPLYEAAFFENQEPGLHVTKVKAEDMDSGTNAALTYYMIPGPGHELFRIIPHTGEVVTAAVFDRETRDHFIIKVMVKDSGSPSSSSFTTILCRVLDENDNTPELLLPEAAISVPENQDLGIIHKVLATDKDTGNNGRVHFQIIGGNAGEYFAINNTSGEIWATRSLDREDVSNFTITVECYDLGSPRKSTTAKLHIKVLDENDNPPTFSKSQYRTSVREDLTVGSVVLSLQAFDMDEGINGEVTYSLIDDTQGAFIINQTTGNIVIAKTLDRELKQHYVYRAVASDCSVYGRKSATAKVIVHIEDANDNEPQFSVNPVQVLVSPQILVNATVATVHASDPDLGLNGTVVYSFMEDNPLFHIIRETGEIKLHKSLSTVTFTNAILKVKASDLGIPAKTSTGLLTITLEGLENEISFVQSHYDVIILENSEPGSAVLTVEARHYNPDDGPILYSLVSGDTEAFMLNSDTGELTVKNTLLLDFEYRNKMHLVISAETRASVAYCGVSVLIQDENDNAPVFDRDHHITSVLEGQGYNIFILQVFATDADSGTNGQVDYSIVDGNENKAFLIDSRKGVITTNAILDREIKASYRLVLEAADRGSPSLSATSIVTVLVVDVNDNAPTIPPLGTIFIPEDSKPGHFVTCVTANDVDLRPNASYSFTGDGNPDLKFDIDKYTGIITLTGVLDYEDVSEYHLRIQASDSLHLTEAELIVEVLDVNDNPPLFIKDSYEVTVPELAGPDTFIISVSATDKDSEIYGPISYRIIFPLKGFVINPNTGAVHNDHPVEIMEKNIVIHIIVEAKDSGNPALSSTAIIQLQIHDINNHAPVFSKEIYQINISENISVGEAILTFTATDLDWTRENGYIDFSVVSGNLHNLFVVESFRTISQAPFVVTAKVLINGILDYETSTNHTLILMACDRGFPPLSSSATVFINVLDSNDNPPILQKSEYRITVREHHPINTEVITISATDVDSEENAESIYSIVSGNDEGIFIIDPENGTVTLAQHLDYESVMAYCLILKASNGWENGRFESFSVLHVNVLDDNDFIPKFLLNSLTCSLHENMPPFTPVCTANAVDLDSGPFGILSYSIHSPCLNEPKSQDAFFIDVLTGDLYTKHKIDFETQKRYCFVVQVKDRSESTACVLLYVNIEGQDEFPPVFHEDQYLFDLPTENKAGEILGIVSALDKDEGDDGVILYSLEKPSPFFSINASSGVIYLMRSVHKMRSNTKKKDDIIELVVKAQGPKLDSKSSTCTVQVNISTALEGYFGMSANILSISFSISFVVFLLLAISLIGIILRYKRKDVVNACGIKEAAIPALPSSNVKDCVSDECPKYENINGTIAPDTSEWLGLVGIREKKDTGNKCRNSDSSGHGSTEGETAEDEEIKMINEYPIRKESDSVLSERASRVPDSGIPRESDLLSCESDETDLVIGSESTDCVEIIKEEDGLGECHVHYTCKTELPSAQNNNDKNLKDIKPVPEISQDYVYVPMSYDSRYGSLASLVASDEDLRGSYNWDYLLSWEPRFQTLSSVFCDIGRLKDEKMNRNAPKQKKPFIFPPPLITSVAQPGIRAVPPRMPTIMSGQTFMKYPRSPFFSNLASQSSTMPPTFSPSLSMLTVHTPSMSPVRAGVSGTSVPALSEELLIHQEFQV